MNYPTFRNWPGASIPKRWTFSTGNIFGLPRVVSVQEISDLKTEIHHDVLQLDESVDACTKIPNSSRNAWKSFVTEWSTYYAKDISWLFNDFEWDKAQEYRRKVDAWKEWYVKFQCPMIGPPSPMKPPANSSGLSDKTHTTLQVVAISGAVIALVIGLRTVMK